MEKTKFVDFNKDDFDLIGIPFKHWRKRRNENSMCFIIEPTENYPKDFKQKIKDKIRKNLTLNTKSWLDRVNPIIKGKVIYYLNLYKAIKATQSYINHNSFQTR